MDRKDFLVKTCALCGVGATLTFIDSCSKTGAGNIDFTVDLTASSSAPLQTAGGHIIQNNVIIFKTSSGYSALSLSCTHEGCTVNYTGSGYLCPCHSGRFDANGNVISGPPPSALVKCTVTESGNILTVKG